MVTNFFFSFQLRVINTVEAYLNKECLLANSHQQTTSKTISNTLGMLTQNNLFLSNTFGANSMVVRSVVSAVASKQEGCCIKTLLLCSPACALYSPTINPLTPKPWNICHKIKFFWKSRVYWTTWQISLKNEFNFYFHIWLLICNVFVTCGFL